MAIDWATTASALESALAGSGLPRGEAAVGAAVLSTLTAAGNTYDRNGNDGPLNRSPYAASFQGWWGAALPAGLELDRLARIICIAGLVAPISAATLRAFDAFGMAALPPNPWMAGSPYALGAIVNPSPPNGMYFVCTVAGSSGGSSPSWNTTLGSLTADGGTLVWGANIPVMPASATSKVVALPLDSSLLYSPALSGRAAAAGVIVAALGLRGLSGLLTPAAAAWASALVARPPVDAGADAASSASIAALNTALAAATTWLSVASVV